MVAIADKFGKASISTNYATATTVKTARLAGVLVLETFDLSKFAIDTPVYFITYRKTTDPVTGIVSVTNQVSWKALVNPDVNTLTNLTVAPGYTDLGNSVGDFVECIPTSYWGNSLVEGVLTHTNPDGTLKQAAVQAALNISALASADWTALANIPVVVSSNGQKENSLTFTGVDYTDRLQKGSKLRIPRTSTVPTQSAKFISASSQYANKVTPAGMTFTDNFTVEAWINPASYVFGTIGSRTDAAAANGLGLRLTAAGQLEVWGANAGAGNVRVATTYQSIPLNKRTHVAISWATGVIVMYLDGVAVPNYQQAFGTSPTTIVQAGDFAIGRQGSASAQYLNGEVSDFRIHSVVKTAAQIRDNMGKQLVGNEANLVGYWKLNGDFLDSTANANHLTAQAGAVATTVSHAFSPIEYAIVTSTPVFAAGNTTCTVFTGNGVLPNETLGATSYSGQRAPFGFPADAGLWKVTTLKRANESGVATGIGGSFIATNHKLTLPSGAWKLKHEGAYDQANSVGGNVQTSTRVNGATTGTIEGLNTYKFTLGVALTAFVYQDSKAVDIFLSVMDTLTLQIACFSGGGTTTADIRGDLAQAEITATLAYL